MQLCIRLPKSKYAQTQGLHHLINTPDNQLTPYLWRIRNGDREMWTQVTVVIAKGVLRVDAVRLIYHSFLDS